MKKYFFSFRSCLLIVALLISQYIYANTNVVITGIGNTRIPIAINTFNTSAGITDQVSPIVQKDLVQSSRFTIIPNDNNSPLNTRIDYDYLRNQGINALVNGNIQAISPDQYQLRFILFDTIKAQSLGGFSVNFSPNQAHFVAHKIADFIYQKLLGIPGIFSTKIAYVVNTGRQYQLQIADYDGQYPVAALNTAQPIISPKWSNDGLQLAYVSFEQQKPMIYIQQLSTGKRYIAANQKGSNSAPAWSPNGQSLAAALSLSGNTQIYHLSLTGQSAPQRLTLDQNISTEPCYSPDGQWIYFTSDRGGTPQIYKMPATGEQTQAAQRITFVGTYNTSPSVSPDGKLLAYISRTSQGFQLYVQDLSTGISHPVTNTQDDSSPSFSANSQLILYSTKVNGKSTLAIASADGSAAPVILSLPVQGKVEEASWGPFINQ